MYVCYNYVYMHMNTYIYTIHTYIHTYIVHKYIHIYILVIVGCYTVSKEM